MKKKEDKYGLISLIFGVFSVIFELLGIISSFFTFLGFIFMILTFIFANMQIKRYKNNLAVGGLILAFFSLSLFFFSLILFSISYTSEIKVISTTESVVIDGYRPCEFMCDMECQHVGFEKLKSYSVTNQKPYLPKPEYNECRCECGRY